MNLLIKNLKSPYKELAIKRTREWLPEFFFTFCNTTPEDRTIRTCFILDNTPEGKDFWMAVSRGEKPEIPKIKPTPIETVLSDLSGLMDYHLEIRQYPYDSGDYVGGKDELLTAIEELLKKHIK